VEKGRLCLEEKKKEPPRHFEHGQKTLLVIGGRVPELLPLLHAVLTTNVIYHSKNNIMARTLNAVQEDVVVQLFDDTER
jgi:hypothetical protein